MVLSSFTSYVNCRVMQCDPNKGTEIHHTRFEMKNGMHTGRKSNIEMFAGLRFLFCAVWLEVWPFCLTHKSTTSSIFGVYIPCVTMRWYTYTMIRLIKFIMVVQPLHRYALYTFWLPKPISSVEWKLYGVHSTIY